MDSTDAIALIDSAYVQARTVAGTDSSATQAMIDSSISFQVDSAYVQARQINNPSGVDSAATIALIDSAYVQARQTTSVSGVDSAATLALIDSSHVQSKFNTLRESDNTLIVSGNIIPSADSSFSLGTSEKKFKDIHLSGGTVFIDNLALSADSATRTISIGELDSAGVVNVVGVIATVDSAGVSAIVDSAFLEARLQSFVSETELAAFNYSTFDSTSATNLIDSAYVQARQTSGGGGSGLDSTSTIALIDSAYVQARQTTIGTTDSATVSTIIVADVDSAYVQARQTVGITGIDVQDQGYTLSTKATALNFTGSIVTAAGDGGTTKTITINGLDSSSVTGVVDSNYVQERVTLRDSSFVEGVVDSNYVQERVTLRDSAFVTNIVDQTYINNTLGVDYGEIIVNATNALDILLAAVNVDYGTPTSPASLKSNYGAI